MATSDRRFPPVELPACFQPILYVCPNPDCLFIGSVKHQDESGTFCWSCTTLLGEADRRIFGTAEPAIARDMRRLELPVDDVRLLNAGLSMAIQIYDAVEEDGGVPAHAPLYGKRDRLAELARQCDHVANCGAAT